jgi:hypothetical protein
VRRRHVALPHSRRHRDPSQRGQDSAVREALAAACTGALAPVAQSNFSRLVPKVELWERLAELDQSDAVEPANEPLTASDLKTKIAQLKERKAEYQELRVATEAAAVAEMRHQVKELTGRSWGARCVTAPKNSTATCAAGADTSASGHSGARSWNGTSGCGEGCGCAGGNAGDARSRRGLQGGGGLEPRP